MMVSTILTFFSALSFVLFGVACFTSTHMKIEFSRYGLKKFRKIVGGLQLLGAAGLLLGYWLFTEIQIAAAGGLALLMILGFVVRLKIRDSALQAAPSLLYAVLNTYLFAILLQ